LKRKAFKNPLPRDPFSLVCFFLLRLAVLSVIGIFSALVGLILVKGLPHLTASLFAAKYSSENVSLLPALINTVTMMLLSMLIAVPLGVFAAIYLVEYAPRRSRLVAGVRAAAETLAGVPSIIYGLFGLLFFVTALGWGFSILAGACTLSIMVLPLIMRTAEEALKSVPDGWRQDSFGLGAGKLRTVFAMALPAAVPGILAGVILAAGRILGETAALIYTAGTVADVPANILGSGRTLSVHMYVLFSEGLQTEKAYATAVVLLALVFGVNTLSGMLAKKIGKGVGGFGG
jgi:phosphate transport system permease protein